MTPHGLRRFLWVPGSEHWGEDAMRCRTAALVAVVGLSCACASNKPITSVHNAAAPAAEASVDFDALLVRLDHLEKLPATTPILIDNPYGDVRLRFGGYENTVELHVTEQRPDATLPTFEYRHQLESGSYRIAPTLPTGVALQTHQRTDLVVYVPQGHPVQVSTVRGMVESRGLKSDLLIRSEAGNILLRGTLGLLDVQTDAGTIEVALEDAPVGSSQRLVTTTGLITAALADSSNVDVTLSTSAPMTTEFSLQIDHLPGQEPNKRGRAQIGQPSARLQIESKRGEIRVLRRAAFTPVASSS
jgi:hypothetical protein